MRFLPLLLFGGYFLFYYFTHQQESSFTGRKHLVDTSIEQEVALGFQSYQEILAESEVVTDGELPGQVREIARRLIEAGPKVEDYLAQNKNTPKTTPWEAFEWDVKVINSDQINAFCLPGGKIAVFTGIVPVAKNENGLAAVMGHEIAHALLRHGGERLAQQKLVQLGSMAAGMSMGDMDPQQQRMVMAALGAGVQYGVLLPFSRDHETEADYLGLMMSAAACYDPTEAPRLWERMGEASTGRGQPPEFMSTHPNHESRIRQLNADMPAALEIRAAFCGTAP